MKILIKSATVVDRNSPLDGKKRDILIRDGVIEKIAHSITETDKDTDLLKLKNLHVSRGWFDPSVSFGEPGYEDRETLENGAYMAASSGYCDLLLNPNSHPVPDSSGQIRFLIDKTAWEACRVHPLGTITRGKKGEELAELFDMHRHGAVAFTEDQNYLSDSHLMQLALQYATLFGGCIVSFPLEGHLAKRGMVHEGPVAVNMGLKGIPSMAEELAIARDIRLQEYTGGKLHLSLISAEASVKLLAEAKKRGRDISAAVSIDHLLFTEDDLAGFDQNLKILPPLRSKRDRKILRDALVAGTIDMVTSDHRPLTREEKEVEFSRSQYGSIGLETSLAALLTVFDLSTAIDLLTRGKDRFGIPDLPLEEGAEASLSLFDPEKTFVYSGQWQLSSARNSPFLGKEVRGAAYGIISNGQVVLRPGHH